MAPSPPSSHLVLAAIEPSVGNGIVKCSGGTYIFILGLSQLSLFLVDDRSLQWLRVAEV